MKMENEKEDGFIKTTTHNFVSRKATIDGAKQVEIKGRSIIHDVKIRGDLVSSSIGFTASLCSVLARLLCCKLWLCFVSFVATFEKIADFVSHVFSFLPLGHNPNWTLLCH